MQEPVESAEPGCEMDRRPAVQRQRLGTRPAEPVHAQQLGDPTAARDVRLQHVDGCRSSARSSRRRSRTRRPRSPSRPGPARAPAAVRPDRRRRPAPRTSSRRRRPRSARRAPSACLGVNAPLASTNSSAFGPIAWRAQRTRCRVVLRVRADLHLHARDPALHPAGELLLEPADRVRREAARAVDRHAVRWPGRAGGTSGSSSSRAFRSQSAHVDRGDAPSKRSPAGRGCAPAPTIADHAAGGDERVAVPGRCPGSFDSTRAWPLQTSA